MLAMQGPKKAVENMSGEIIDGLERRITELEVVAYNAKHLENLLLEWAAMPERKQQPRASVEERMLIAVDAIEKRRGLIP